jgi:hypothetical protein
MGATSHLPGLEPPSKPPPISESELQNAIIDLARQLGWRIAHFRPAMTRHGWRTPVSADGKGFPDLILVRDRVIAAEIKTDKGKLTDDQETWLDAFQAAGIAVAVWRPEQWWDGTIDTILAIQTQREAA